MNYKGQLTEAMAWLGEQSDTVFLGQQVLYPGNAIFGTLKDVPDDKKVEFPVAEELQVGASIGLALQGYVPICIIPRMDFLWRAADQLVNHLDKIREMSRGEFNPRIIIRTAIGSTSPLDPGPQHRGDYTDVLETLLPNVRVMRLTTPYDIQPAYMGAYASKRSWLLVEDSNLYGAD